MWQTWVILVLGAYLFLSPWILGVSGQVGVLWNNILIGLAVVVLAIWDLSAENQLRNYRDRMGDRHH